MILHFWKTVAWLLLAAVSVQAQGTYRVTAPPARLKLDPFYKKYTEAQGYPIVASERVNDYALKEAAYLVDMLLAKRPDVRRAMIESGSRLVVMAHDEYSTDIPEYAHMKPKDFWDRRARGFGGSRTDPICSCGEENLLAYAGDPYHTENILIHEFAHNIHLRGMVRVDETFDARVKQAYDAAMAKGLWKGKYASVNHHEYFAEGVQSWFDNNREPDHDHNHVNTRKELIDYDPGLADLCREVFGDTKVAYTKPATRLRDHLAGYDPSKAPKFEWPERLAAVGQAIRQKAERRGQNAASQDNKAHYDPVRKNIEGWTVHVDPRMLSGEHAEAGAEALKMLANHLQRIAVLLPADRLKKMRTLEIWIEHHHELGNMQYHPGIGWLKDKGYDPRLVKKVHIPRAAALLSRSQMIKHPAVVLHELAHAYHDQILGFDDKRVEAAYAKAMESGRYQKVLLYDGRKVLHYAATNAKEYFAEATEAYFYRNDFYPFVRAELKEHDPTVHDLLVEIWGPLK